MEIKVELDAHVGPIPDSKVIAFAIQLPEWLDGPVEGAFAQAGATKNADGSMTVRLGGAGSVPLGVNYLFIHASELIPVGATGIMTLIPNGAPAAQAAPAQELTAQPAQGVEAHTLTVETGGENATSN